MHNLPDDFWLLHRHQRIAVFDDNPALQQVPPGILTKVARIGSRLVILDPQVVVFPGGPQVVLAGGYFEGHDPPVTFDKDLLEVEIVCGKTDQGQGRGDQKAGFGLLQVERTEQGQQANGKCPEPVQIGNHVLLLAGRLLVFFQQATITERQITFIAS